MLSKIVFTRLILALSLWGGILHQVHAANGSVRFRNGTILIEGDDYQDLCWVRIDGNRVTVRLEVYDEEGRLDDLDERDFDAEDAELIRFEGYGGADRFWNRTGIASEAYGGEGDDDFWGGTGKDLFEGGPGQDHLWGNQGDDLLDGDTGDDWLFGGPGQDQLYGGPSEDHLQGGPGRDLMFGGNGDDHLYGGYDRDRLYGGEGKDFLQAGFGEDENKILGGAGHDTFAVPQKLLWGMFWVTIDVHVDFTDYDPAEDSIHLFEVYWTWFLRGLELRL